MRVHCWSFKQKETVLVGFTRRIEEIASFQFPGNGLICSNNETTSVTEAVIGITVIMLSVIHCHSLRHICTLH